MFICIIRDPFTWVNSFYKNQHHLPKDTYNCIDEFINKTIYSIHNDGQNEVMEDRNIFTKERYKNIFELRYTKLKYMTEVLPQKVKHCIFICYEDLLDDFENTMNKLKKCGLTTREQISFPTNNTTCEFSYKDIYFERNKPLNFPKELVYNHKYFLPDVEKLLGYV